MLARSSTGFHCVAPSGPWYEPCCCCGPCAPSPGCPCSSCSLASGSGATPARARRWTGLNTSSLRDRVPRSGRLRRDARRRPRKRSAAWPRNSPRSRNRRRPSARIVASVGTEVCLRHDDHAVAVVPAMVWSLADERWLARHAANRAQGTRAVGGGLRFAIKMLQMHDPDGVVRMIDRWIRNTLRIDRTVADRPSRVSSGPRTGC